MLSASSKDDDSVTGPYLANQDKLLEQKILHKNNQNQNAMKNFLLILSGLIIGTAIMAQVPMGITHQAVIRDANNELLINQEVGIRVSILKGAADDMQTMYVETHTATTNANGLLTFIIGKGQPEEGLFEELEFAVEEIEITSVKIEVDPEGGTNYTIEGITQLYSVPYALHAKTAKGTIEDGKEFGEMLFWDGAEWARIEPPEQDTLPSILMFNIASIEDPPGWQGVMGFIEVAVNFFSPSISTISADCINQTIYAEGNVENAIKFKHDILEKGFVWSDVNNNPNIYDNSISFPPSWGNYSSGGFSASPVNSWPIFLRAYANVSHSFLGGSGYYIYGEVIEVHCQNGDYELILDEAPQGAAYSLEGAGFYPHNYVVDIKAILETGWVFVEWTGDTQHLINSPYDNLNQVIMGASPIHLTAVFDEWNDCGQDYSFNYMGQQVTVGTVWKHGICWFDRNLGSDPRPFDPAMDASGPTDTRLYGDLYQWGRLVDGHQDSQSNTTATISNTDVPGHGDFITAISSPYDWRAPQNDNLWQGVYGTNNPCPLGWRLPTEEELETERLSWGSNNSAGAFISTLKWPVGGERSLDGTLEGVDEWGHVWSSSVLNIYGRALCFGNTGASINSHYRADGLSVRCVLDDLQLPDLYNLDLHPDPVGGGSVTGAGQYPENATVTISATANQGWVFLEWTGNTSYVDDPTSATTLVTMPAYDIALTAIFEEEDALFSCGDDVTFTYRGAQVTYGTISRVGLCWLDRNLGADPMPFDPAGTVTNTNTSLYGDLFQWGRLDDGHQDRQSGTTPIPSNTDVPGHGNFITVFSTPHDWRMPQNDNLWQGVDGINNPCPPGWRLPTEPELNAERLSWNTNDLTGAWESTLKWPLAGLRATNGSLGAVNLYGYVFSKSLSGTRARQLSYFTNNADVYDIIRGGGASVRCVRD